MLNSGRACFSRELLGLGYCGSHKLAVLSVGFVVQAEHFETFYMKVQIFSLFKYQRMTVDKV